MKRRQMIHMVKACRRSLILAGVLILGTSVWAAPGSSSSHHSQKKTESEPEGMIQTTDADSSKGEAGDEVFFVMGEGWWDDVDEFDLETDAAHSVFGNEAYRHDQIRSITFTQSLDAAADAWDISEDRDETVLCWAEPAGELFDLYIGAEGPILAPLNCGKLFYAFTNAEKIDFAGCFDTEGVTDMCGMFEGCGSLQELDASVLDTSESTDLALMFSECAALRTLDVSGFDTAAAEDMALMFNECGSLMTLDVSGFDTSKVRDLRFMFTDCQNLKALDVAGFDTGMAEQMAGMFAGCESLTSLDVSGFDTFGVANLNFMFYDCQNLESLDVASFDTSYAESMRYMFAFCTSLTSLDVSGFDTSAALDLTGMFDTCTALTELKANLTIGADTVTEDLFNACDKLPEEMKKIG